MPFQLSPGVAVVEKDFTSIVPAVSTSIGAFAGAFQWGPVMEPVTVGSENELVRRFGKPNDSNAQSFFTAANFLSYTNNLLLVRADTTHLNAVAQSTGGVTDINIVAAGSGYSSISAPPTVTIGAPDIAGGIQATAHAVLSGGGISAITLRGGVFTGDTTNSSVTVSNVSSFSGLQVGDPITGTGIPLGATIATLNPGANSLTLNIAATQTNTGTTLRYGGAGYTDNPAEGTVATVNIVAAPGDTGQGATATAVVVAGVITQINIQTPGTGYKALPIVTIGGTNTAPAIVGSITISSSSIADIVIDNGGTGYTSAPSVTIAAPVTGSQATASSVLLAGIGLKIKNGEHYVQNYVNGQGVVGEWAAKYPGTLGNSLKVSMADAATFSTWAYKDEFDSAPGTSPYAASVNGSNDELHIIVVDEDGVITGTIGTVLEKFSFVSKASDGRKPDGTNNYYRNVLNARSEWIWWMDHPTALAVSGQSWGQDAASRTFKSLNTAITRSFVGGTDNYNITDGEKMNAYALFANAEQYDISLVMAGKASATVAEFIINDIAETRLDCVAFISPESVTSGEPIIGSTSTEQNAIIAYRDELPSTSYAVMDSGFKYQYDRYNDKYRWIPLNGDIAGLCARTDYTNDPWWSPGGLNRGQVKNVVRLAFNPTKTQRDMLYKSGVNPVVTFPGEGTVLFGDKTLLAKPSAFDRINVRRLFIVLEKAIATAAKFQLFEFNDSFTRAQFKNLVEPFLRDVQGRRGVTDFVVKCDESNNTGEVIDRNEFVADIFIKPNRSINFITLNFIAARSAINFSEIGA